MSPDSQELNSASNVIQSSLFTSTDHDPGCKKLIRLTPDIQSTAQFGGPGYCYRYTLRHRWSVGPMVLFLMKNPSAAGTEGITDATVAKCGRFARRWRFGGLLVGNVCAFRATDQGRLLEIADPVGPENHTHVLAIAQEADLIVVAHGRLPGKLQGHADALVGKLRQAGHLLYVLRLGLSGVPVHPLFLPEDLKPVVWK